MAMAQKEVLWVLPDKVGQVTSSLSECHLFLVRNQAPFLLFLASTA